MKPLPPSIVHILDLLERWAPVTARAMFGGYGLYRDKRIFAIVIDEELYFKVHPHTRADYEAAGSAPFTYMGKDKPVQMSYWKVPPQLLEDPDTLTIWAQKAWDY